VDLRVFSAPEEESGGSVARVSYHRKTFGDAGTICTSYRASITYASDGENSIMLSRENSLLMTAIFHS